MSGMYFKKMTLDLKILDTSNFSETHRQEQ